MTRFGPEGHQATLGCRVAREARGRGIGTRALRAVADWTLASTAVIRLDVFIMVGYTTSVRMTAHVTGNWCHVYPLRLSEEPAEHGMLPASEEWRENLSAEVAGRLERAIGRRPSVEDVACYTFGVLSAPSYRARFTAALAIDHPRIPLPADAGAFAHMVELGRELAEAHLLEAPVSPDIRFLGVGDGIVDDARYDAEAESIRVNRTQAFTGVPPDAWAWGHGFRPLEHYLDERRGRRLDAEQIAGFQSAIHAVRECIRLEPSLDVALERIIETAS